MPNRTQIPKPIPDDKQKTSLSNVVGASKRLTLIYVVLSVWIALAIFGIIIETDIYALAVYFASGLPIILGYLWAETSRPTNAAAIVRGIGMRPGNMGGNYGGYNSYGGNNMGGGNMGGNMNSPGNNYDTNYGNEQNVYNDESQINIINIYSNDSSVELQVNENQLTTLMNIGYIDTIDNRYTFDKNLLTQIKSLVNEKLQEPEI